MNTREVFYDGLDDSTLIATYAWHDGHNGYVIHWMDVATLMQLPGYTEQGTFTKPIAEEADTIYWILTHIEQSRRAQLRFRSRTFKTTLHFNADELTNPDLDDIQSELNCEP